MKSVMKLVIVACLAFAAAEWRASRDNDYDYDYDYDDDDDDMFSDASAFDQDLGWCVENYDGYPSNAFSGTLCESTSCGVVNMFRCPTPAPTYAPTLSSAPTSTPAPTASAAPTASDNTDAAPARHLASLAAVATLVSLLA